VILSLAIWFAIHTLFRETIPVRLSFLNFDAPHISSLNIWASVLAIAAAISIFRFKVGMIPTLLGCCAAGIALHLAGAI
jgi:chromate transporter